jgi:hypothetical protein
MKHATRIGRFAGLAVGLGIGAALAATPGVASADPSTDWLSSIDSLVSGGALPAAAPSGLDLAISFDGYSLVSDGTASAETTSGDYGLAIASGNDASATATDGTGDYALADGAGTTAISGTGNDDSAYAIGAGSVAGAGTGNDDTAFASGGGQALASGDVVTDPTPVEYPGNDDFAAAIGPDAKAESGDLFTNVASSNDTAIVVDPTGTEGSTAFAGEGNFDLAAAFGDMLHASATELNNVIDILPSLF